METKAASSAPFRLHIEEDKQSFRKIFDAEGNASGIGHFYLELEVTALTETLYLPLSIASGKKPTGFVYQIEGTGESQIVTTDVSLRNVKRSGVTQIRLGTITYVEIPKDMTATFHFSIEMKGKIGREYSIAITHIQYKNDLSDARYKKYVDEIRTGVLKFR